MVALDIVHASNSRLRELGPGLVALFVGGTSGIGEFTLKAFVQNTISPKVYIVGRSAPAAERIIEECKAINKDGNVEFLQANVTELAEVDRVCKEIEKKESKINLIVQTQGNLTLAGRLGRSHSYPPTTIFTDVSIESPEGIDRKFTLNYYSRMRFIENLRPLLRTATTTAPHFSRTLSVLSGGHGEGKLDFDDLELKNNYSGVRCATHTITMNSIMIEEFAGRDPGTTFAHSYPSGVNTGITRELPVWARAGVTLLKPLLLPFMVSVEETGARQLFIATSGIYAPLKPTGALASGVSAPKGMEIMNGVDGKVGSGAYIVNWNDDIATSKILKEYREKGIGKTVWEHTMGIFERVEKVNKARAEAGSK
ncbi:Oxidoreductase [Lachnellula subtilissima]|uniref:Oxidoreductase n=1 Tax=Lachnellula subtilissima TaxID=602034 RepID=A0A8H8RMH0_9HELO|nr:Oxidoreductase [Lachnellula subtilissima]